MDALIGYTGFVGSNLIGKIGSNVDYYNSKNILDMQGKVYNRIYCCGLYAEKWRVNKDPDSDKMAIKKLTDVLESVKCSTFYLISTIDVLEPGMCQSEEADYIPIVYSKHSYGIHRRQMEEWCQAHFETCYIFRLPALFGPNLKKNALYDLIHTNNVEKLRSHWVFQWYNVEWLFDDIEYYTNKNKHLVHLVSPPIELKTIQRIFFPNCKLSNVNDSVVNYRFETNYRKRTIVEVLESMADFIHTHSKQNLLVSEMAWEPQHSNIMKAYLGAKGIFETEAVPSKHNWDLSTYNTMYSAQSLLYNMDIQIFQEQERFLLHIQKICDELSKKGVKVLIFGSPKQRTWQGEDAVELFHKIGDICRQYNIFFCLENNSKQYGCNWMTTGRECLEFVKQVDHPFIRVNLDIGSMVMENEELKIEHQDVNYIQHVQVSFENLGTWNKQQEDIVQGILQDLLEAGYSRKVSLEMKYQGYLPFQEIETFCRFMKKIMN